MKKNSAYISFLIGDLESYILSNKDEINKYIVNNKTIPYDKSLDILEKFAKSLSKTSYLINHLEEVDDTEILRDIFIVSSESLAWILFTLPSINEKLPIFIEELDIQGQNILDVIGNNLMQIEMFIDNPKSSKYVSGHLKKNINELSMALGHIYNMIQKGSLEN